MPDTIQPVHAERLWDVLSEEMGPSEKRMLRKVLFALSIMTAELAQLAKEDLNDERV